MHSPSVAKIQAWCWNRLTGSYLGLTILSLLNFGLWYLLWLLLPIFLRWAVGGIAALCLLRVCLGRWEGQDAPYPVFLIGMSAVLGLSVSPIGWVIAEVMTSEEMVSVFQAVKTMMEFVFQAIKTWW